MYNLNFISKDKLKQHIKNTILSYRESTSININNFNRNIIDSVKLTFDAEVLYGGDYESAIKAEISRQSDKTNSNLIGYFHQNIFSFFNDNSWEVPSTGFDIVNESKMIYVELKNKHNTMNNDSSTNLLNDMKSKLIENPNAKCYLVEIVATNSQNIVWSRLGNTDERIRRVSIDQFYELVTGEPLAFYNLIQQLKPLIRECVLELDSIPTSVSSQDSVIERLNNDYDSLYEGLTSLTFSRYKGF